MSKESALVKRTAIYAVGNFGSKILAYVMVLVYSYYITPEDLGVYDIILTTLSMIQPLVLFQINDGVYRYLVDAPKNERGAIIGNGFTFLCLTTLAAELGLLGMSFIMDLQYAPWIAGLLASTILFVYLQDVVRGLGQSKLYAIIGVLNSLVMLVCETVGLVVFHLGVAALMISKVLANIICVVVMLVKIRETHGAFVSRMHRDVMLPLLKYSAPLVPNTISWWVVNFSNRYIILGFLGAAYNGIFSMANKFPTILTTITSIFYMAWQESAIKEYHTPNRDIFFSNVFRKYYVLLFTLCMCAAPATRFVIELFVSPEYQDAWQYTGLLYLGASFSALCSFLGMGYQISKETKRSLYTSIYAAIINVAVNLVFVRVIGLHAASLATFASYLCMFLIRTQHTKRYFKLYIKWGEFFVLTTAVLVVVIATALLPNLWLCIPLGFICVGVLIVMNRELIMPMVNKMLKNSVCRND